jgi:HlyD family secretion protein
LWIGLAIIGALFVGALYYSINRPAAGAPTITTVTRGDLSATVNANARVRAQSSVRLAFPMSGLITAVNVAEGDRVKAGDVLAALDPREVERRVRQAEMALAARQQDLLDAQQPPTAQDLEIAEQNLKKAALALSAAQNRYQENATDDNRIAQEIAQSDYDIARAGFERQTRGPTQAERDRLERAVENAQLDLQAARESLAAAELRAPFDGVITEVNAEPDQLLGAYNPVVVIEDIDHLELLGEIDEIDVGEVREGQSVEIRFDAFPGEIATGRLVRLFPAAATDRGATVYRAIISLDPTELELRPGMGATLKIATVEKTDVLRVPSRAVKNAGTQKIVVVQNGTGTENIVVETGLSDGNQTEIISGLEEGQVIVLE